MPNRVVRLHDLLTSRVVQQGPSEQARPAITQLWTRNNLSGRLTEISGAASLTAVTGLVLESQHEGEPVAWIGHAGAIFYPPDLAESGVDLSALAVVRLPPGRVGEKAAGRAADRLLRSGAFGLIVLDLGRNASLTHALQGRLVGLAQKHDAAVVCITEKSADAPSLGSMVSLRIEALRAAKPPDAEGFRCQLHALKDKQRGPGWEHEEIVRGPAGLR